MGAAREWRALVLPAQCVTLWIGPSLGPIERACLKSVLRQGHPLALYCYREPDGVPDGVELRDAATIIPEAEIIRHRTGSVALFANRFRYELQRRGLGTWLDCDAYLLKPLDSTDPYLFGEYEPDKINNGVLRLPVDSPLLAPLLALFEEKAIPPWLPLRARLAARWRLATTGKAGIADMPWGSAGPIALTHLARSCGLMKHARPVEELYPLPWQEAARIAEEPLQRLVTAQTVSIHVWNERIKHFKDRAGKPGSFLAQLQAEGALPVESPAIRGDAPPPLSVVMPVRNALPYLEESLASLSRQTFSDFELVIGDDGSNDGSEGLLQEWAAKDDRVRLHRRENASGHAAAGNWVMSLARAPLVARLDGDDLAAPTRLEREMELFASEPGVALVGALFDTIDGAGRYIRPVDRWRLVADAPFAPFAHSSMMIRSEVFARAGRYRGKAGAWEDLDLYLRVLKFGRILVIPEVLTTVRRADVSERLRSDGEGLERVIDRMYRCVKEYGDSGHYEDLLFDDSPAKVDPMVFVALGSMHLWSGAKPHVLRRLLKRGDMGMGRRSFQALVWALWAEIHPPTLRQTLRTLLHARNLGARRRLRGHRFVEWNPDPRAPPPATPREQNAGTAK